MEGINSGYKEVYFEEYCQKCKHEKLKESEDPCYDCLMEAVNLNSHKPVKFEEK
jgi:hypothetical protein